MYRWFIVYLSLDLINNVGYNYGFVSVCASNHVRSLYRSRVNNYLKHTLDMFIPFAGRFQCMIAFINYDHYQPRKMEIGSKELINVTNTIRSIRSKKINV